MKANTSILPFYTDINRQNHRRSYAYGQTYPLYCETSYLPPFQIIRAHRSSGLASAILVDMEGNSVEDLVTLLYDSGLVIKTFTEYDVIVYPAWLPFGQSIPEGRYYLRLSDGIDTWYSDVFTVVGDVSPFLRVEWWDEEDFIYHDGRIVYEYDEGNRFHNVVYLATELGKPEYTFEEEGEKRDGYYYPEKQISQKTYRFTALAPEYLLDVMRMAGMADHVFVTDKYGVRYECDTFLMTPKWEEQGDLASVEMEFTTDSVMKKLPYVHIPPTDVLGDFNNDFNNDFDITETNEQ